MLQKELYLVQEKQVERVEMGLMDVLVVVLGSLALAIAAFVVGFKLQPPAPAPARQEPAAPSPITSRSHCGA